jgi:hypothetical protein
MFRQHVQHAYIITTFVRVLDSWASLVQPSLLVLLAIARWLSSRRFKWTRLLGGESYAPCLIRFRLLVIHLGSLFHFLLIGEVETG